MLNAERVALKEFLNSSAYLAGKKIVDQRYLDAQEVIYGLDPSTENYIPQLMQAIGEGRAYRNWSIPFTDRLEELDEILGSPTSEEQQ